MIEQVDPFLFGGEDEDVKKTQELYLKYFEGKDRVLDLGCGNGIFLELLKSKGITGIGVDLHQPSIDRCRQGGFEVHQSDVLEFLRSTPEKYDGVLASHLIEHLDSKDALEFVKLVVNVLAPDGVFLVTTPNINNPQTWQHRFWLDLDHKRPYPKELLEQMCMAEGLHIIDSGYNGYMGVMIKRGLVSWEKKKKYYLERLRYGFRILEGDTFIVAAKPK